MKRFFAKPEQIDEREIHITGEDVNHIRQVLRMREGEELWVSDGEKKEYHCRIKDFQEDEILLEILYAQESDYELPSRIYLFQGLPKGDKMELIIQKAVELGAFEVIPMATSRCVVKLDKKKAAKKQERWQEIARNAAKQSRRLLVPQIHPVCSLREALDYSGSLDVKLLPYELAKGMRQTKETLAGIKRGQSIGIFIGPEGGFAPEEVEQAMAVGVEPITLGKRILRTETAGMTVLSILMFQLEDE
ncbi:16S rRNA (uracil(1498)-N(3))-methyltransferase [Blautia hydrogenotrophica]|uniref:16S rRNA (uracil(1498)-N(3))-methyltransferase n=1 Tax=Blautia hydrogenotrophica TaxID=53443 RepID=UPI002E79A314|nr:16S rRNA (uracil(1498)-N(3))-methyltransferase [Blautia hydrogenotrophica]MEE0463246.1 16S rRNA (uracil(1498)-N(3))-methyltransferase [Blautia hydrogenotrophica]